jgi:hypothetical protein
MIITEQFTTPTPDRDGRGLSSEIVLPEREDGKHIVLRVTTTGASGGRYRATASRPLISHERGFAVEQIAMTFGGDSDVKALQLPAGIPGGGFSRKTLADLHYSVLASMRAELETWLAWAADSTAARDN